MAKTVLFVAADPKTNTPRPMLRRFFRLPVRLGGIRGMEFGSNHELHGPPFEKVTAPHHTLYQAIDIQLNISSS
jgi:hypothetical protein